MAARRGSTTGLGEVRGAPVPTGPIPMGMRLLGLALASVLAFGLTPRAQAQTAVVRVTIVQVEAIDDYETIGEADHYARVAIPGQTRRTPTIDDKDKVGSEAEPAWEVSFDADLGDFPLEGRIELWDSDPFSDNHIDIGIASGRDLLFNVELGPCRVIADIKPPAGGTPDEFDCGQTILTAGTATDRAAMRFRVEVELPPSTPGTNIQCLHSPIRPQPGDTVTITAVLTDGNLAQTKVGTLEIWLNGQVSSALSLSGVNGATHTFTVGSTSFSYGCRASDGAEFAWTGWRRVAIGDPSEFADEPAWPVVFAAPRRNAIDVVFVPDRTVYTGVDDPQFLTVVGNAIMAYYGLKAFLVAQDRFNFWISRSTGRARDFTQGCDHDVRGISFADVQAIIHNYPTSVLRDCAPGGRRVFSATTTRFPGILRHETGHRPFGLADEYCNRRVPPAGNSCDGGYFQADPLPNLWDDRNDCESDAPSLEDGGVPRTASDCESFEDRNPWWQSNKTWWLSEPTNDLMVNNTIPRAADRRRIEWLLDRCRSGDC